MLEFEKQRLGAMTPLTEMVVSLPDGETQLHDDEDQWKTLCETRFGATVRTALFCLCICLVLVSTGGKTGRWGSCLEMSLS